MNSLSLDFTSMVYHNQILFGGYPSLEWFHALLDHKVVIFVNLTTNEEMKKYQLYPYQDQLLPSQYIHFPIEDNQIPPSSQVFLDSFHKIVKRIMGMKSDEKIYIHCKGGHGRSGMLVACLLTYLLNIKPENALIMTTMAHSYRPNLKIKYKNI